ncbi:MAG: hypothetical protein LQ341_002861 [Variospora aurantia]|nr:MAG: hypothetical protein LQ341_002861 [Variospora aurantia]
MSEDLVTLGNEVLAAFRRASNAFARPRDGSEISSALEAACKAELQRFQVWVINLGLFQSSHNSLDYRLRQNETVRTLIAALLADLCLALDDLVDNVLRGSNNDAKDFDDEAHSPIDANIDMHSSQTGDRRASPYCFSESADEENLMDLYMEDVIEINDELMKIAMQIRSPHLRKPRHNLNPHGEAEHDAQEPYIKALKWFRKKGIEQTLLSARRRLLPNDQAESSLVLSECDEFLVDRLSKANDFRRQQFEYWKKYRSHSVRATTNAAVAADADDSRDRLQPPARFFPAADVPLVKSDQKASKTTSMPSVSLLAPNFELRTLRSARTNQSRALTIHAPGGDLIAWPEVPSSVPIGKEFECPLCFFICPREQRTEEAWRVHLKHDIRPYWIQHEQWSHMCFWRCPKDDSDFEDFPSYKIHVKTQHPAAADENQLLSEGVLATHRSFAAQPSRSCPFCGVALETVREMHDHIGSHLETVALLAVPPLDGSDIQSASDVSSSVTAGKDVDGSRKDDFDKNLPVVFPENDRSNELCSTEQRLSVADFEAHLARLSDEAVDGSVWIKDVIRSEAGNPAPDPNTTLEIVERSWLENSPIMSSFSAGIADDVAWPSDAERAKYTIGWIAPMPKELAPALTLLDPITTIHVADDSNIYKAGRIGNHHVVMATLPKIGLGGIHSVAAGMHASFQNLKHLLLVGIGGGIPDYAHGEQMVLGDVVVSRQVEHLDCGRRTPSRFEHTRQTYSPSPALMKAVNTLSSTHLLHGTRIPETLQEIRTKLRQTIQETSEDPDPDLDWLFDPDYHHKDDAKLCGNCCDLERSKSRHERGRKASRESDSPLIHYGTVGSGNSLVVGSKDRELFYREFGTICFEMEAAALMEYRCLVIRGISDYSDSHKNKAWQTYAAATAAAYAQELVMTLPAPVHEDSSTCQDRTTVHTTSHVHWTVYRSRNPFFTGRDDILHELETTVRDAVNGSSYREQCRIVISDVSTTSSAKNDFLNIAKKLSIHAKSMEEARQGLANVKEPWLLVLDNADDPNVDYQCYFPAGLLGVVLLTSRRSECQRYASTRELAIKLEGLPESDARELLLHATDTPQEQWRTFHDDAQKMVTLLGSSPLALVQAGAYISRAHCTLAEYPQVFHRQRTRLLSFRPSQAQSRYRDVYATFEASADLLQRSQTEAAKDALQLLSMLGICAASRLPLGQLFEAGWAGAQHILSRGNSDDDYLVGLTTWHVSHLPPLLQADADAWDPFRLVEAVELLKAFSLVSAGTDDDALSVSMHPLTNAWALNRLVTAAQHDAWLATGCLVAVTYYDGSFWWKLGRQLHPHVRALTSLAMDVMFASKPQTKVSSIIETCARFLDRMRDDAKVKDLMDNLLAFLSLDPMTVDARWVNIYDLTARNLMDFGKAQKAVFILEQVVQIQEHTKAEDDPILLASQHQLASAYLENRQVEKAALLLELVVRIRMQTLAEDNPDRLASQHQLASAYLDSGQVEKAVVLLQLVVQIGEQTLAKDNPDRLASQHALASVYQANGQWQEAFHLLERVVQIEDKTLAENHPQRLVSQHNLAIMFWNLGRREEALHLMRHVVELRRRVLDEGHPKRKNSEECLKTWEDEMNETKAAENRKI